MTVIEIARLHATYEGVDERSVHRLDDALRYVAADALDAALLDTEMNEAFAVCIREITVGIDADLTLSVHELARQWAGQLARSISAHAAKVTPSDGYVVYRHEVDAIIDIFEAVRSHDRSREWAWRQVGLTPTIAWPNPDDLASLLVNRPHLVHAVLAVSASDTVPFTVAGWIAVGQAVTREYHALLPHKDHTSSDPPSSRPGSSAIELPQVDVLAVERAARTIPAAVWAAADRHERYPLAVLALVVHTPARARQPAAIAAVMSELDRVVGLKHPAEAARTAAIDDSESAATSVGSKRRDHEQPEPSIDQTSGDVPTTTGDDFADSAPLTEAPLTTAHAGLFFLFHAFDALDIIAAAPPSLAQIDPSLLLAAIAHRVSGVVFADPAVAVLTGGSDVDGVRHLLGIVDSPTRDDIEELVAMTNQWLLARLRDPAEGLDWLWLRPATIHSEPGWVDIELPLADVDIRIRRGGLDLDPGFIWWIGAVVRFRYV